MSASFASELPIFLSGPMGSGKTTLGRALASHLGVEFVDLDVSIEEEQGATVASIFALRGEAGFRALEREAARRIANMSGSRVVALGGGTVVDRETRRMLLSRGTLITLRARPETLAARVGEATHRPLLASVSDRTSVLAALLLERAPAYAESHGNVDTEQRSVDDVLAEIVAIAHERPIVVPLGERTYRVEIGRGVSSRIGQRLIAAGVSGSVIVVGDRHVEEPWARKTREHVRDGGLLPIEVTLPPGEAEKTIKSVETIWNAALASGIDRRGAVVAVGGGVVGDLAGFAASTLLRGIRFAQVPTSLLAMVDSSVGGKTGFDRPEGKNLVGTFHQPCAVLCDIDALSTLPQQERISAMAEILKCAWIDGEEAVVELERDAEALVSGDPEATVRSVRRAVSLKARIVAEDEHELGARALLNLGHTLGHAMEAASAYTMRHGDAVARGLVSAMRVSCALSFATEEHSRRLIALLSRLGLPTDPDTYLDAHALGFVGADKKRVGANIRFVLLGAPGEVEVRTIPIDTVRRLATSR
jgi:shikimate kinase/3-dehydroquinate synthase